MKLPVLIGAIAGAVTLSFTLMSAPVIAGNPCGNKMMNPCAMKRMNPCMAKERMAKHHAMKKEHMGMMREVMVILRDLNHRPTAEQKKRLNHYIKKLDEGLAKCKVWEKNNMDGGAHHGK